MNTSSNPTVGQPSRPLARTISDDLWLLAWFACLAAGIIVNSVINHDGFISRDGSNYLRMAQQLLDGGSYVTAPFDVTGQGGNTPVMFAIWPVGYPTLIAAVAKVTGLSVFWASKTLHILLVGGMLLALRTQFKTVHHFVLPLFFVANFYTFSETATEAPFMVSLVALVLSLNRVVQEERPRVTSYLAVVLSVMALFLLRYIGAFSVGMVGLVALYCGLAQRQYGRFFGLGVVATLCTALIGAYLYNNYQMTGYPTGMPRISAPETATELVLTYLHAIAAELVPWRPYASNGTTAIALVMLIAGGIFCWRYRTVLVPQGDANNRLFALFITTAVVYMTAIMGSRFFNQFDAISFRFLAPGSLLLFYAAIMVYQRLPASGPKKVIAAVTLTFVVLSAAFVLVYEGIRDAKLGTYQETVDRVESRFADLQDGDIVLFAPIHFNYLFPTLHNRRPFREPYSAEREPWSDFLTRIQTPATGAAVYLDVPTNSLTDQRFHPSADTFVQQYEPGSLVKLTPAE